MNRAVLGVWLFLAEALAGCSDDDSGCTDVACEMVADHTGCPECLDGTVTCTFGPYSATEPSCGGCQARYALLMQLCEAGVDACEDDLEAGIECVDAE